MRVGVSIDLRRFGVQGNGCKLAGSGMAFLGVVAAAALGGCSRAPSPGRVEDSLTSGRISVVCAPEVLDLIARERAAFQELYPKASITLREGSSTEALRALFAAETDAAAISRELTTEERSAALRGGLDLEGYRFARDAVVVIVNPKRGVENLGLDELRDIYSGRVTSWAALGGPELRIEPVLQPVESDVTQYFVQEVMGSEPLGGRVRYADSDSAVVAEVRRHPEAIGYVSLAWDGRGAKTLRIATVTGLPYWKPDLEAVYKGDYPLTRFYNFYVRAERKPLVSGFITYVTSRDGQAIVHEAGRVPTSVPVRFVRRSPMVGAH